MTSVYLPPVTPGQQAAVAVGFAGPFEAPEGRWRVSVGVGDPTGVWVRSSMQWNGSEASGEAFRLDGLVADDLGSVAVNVQTGGLVVIDLPDAVFDGSLADALWVEAVLGDDAAPEAAVRSDWFPRSAVFGEGAPGLVTGGRFGTVLGADSAPVGTGADPVVVDAGAPAVVQVSGDSAVVELGAPPVDVAGQAVAEVVDVVTFTTDPITLSGGARMRVNLTTGAVDLTTGDLGGPVSLSDDGAPVVQADPSWLPSGAPGPVDPLAPASASLSVDLTAAFDLLGLGAPGESLAVSVTRVVSAADGTQVVAAGMAADRSWLVQGSSLPVLTAPPDTAEESGGDSDVVGLIAVGVVVGLMVVAGSMALASALARRRAVGGTVADPVTVVPGIALASATDDSSADSDVATDEQPRWGTDPVAVDDPDADPDVDDPDVDASPSPLAALDDDLEELARRLRRLDNDGQ